MRAITLLLVLLVLCLAPAVQAQDDCPALIATALETVDSTCEATGRNQVCYGNLTVDATPRNGVPAFQFDQAGDVANVAELSSFGLESAEWGVALLKLQASLPDTLPGQNVIMLLFGDVSLADATELIVELPATATSGVNVRQRPTTEASVIASLRNGQEVTATGRLVDGAWVRVHLEDGSVGWVSADFLDGDLSALLAVEPGAPVFGPMQAFTFTTGLGDAPCETAPDSGILIQTPEGAGTIRLQANGVDIQLGSTVYLQAVPDEFLAVSVLEGHATLRAQGQTQVAPAGTVGRVPLDANGVPSGPPAFPEPYARASMAALPIRQLPETIRIARPLAEDEIQPAIDALVPSNAAIPAIPAGATQGASSGSGSPVAVDGLPPSGRWQVVANVIVNTCDPSTIPVGQVSTAYARLTFSEDRSSLFFEGYLSYMFYRTSDNVYVSVTNYDQLAQILTFTSPTTYFFTHRGNYGDPNAGGCTYYQDENGSFVGN